MKSRATVPSRVVLKKTAKVAKSMCVLVKRKLQRDQVPRSLVFRQLQALVFDPEDSLTRFALQT